MSFPLYETLNKDLSKKDLTDLQKKRLIKLISKLDNDTQNLMYALIKNYFLENEREIASPIIIPYKGKMEKDCINFDLLEFPIALRQLLYKFVMLHKKKVKEDRELEKSKQSIGEN